MKIPDIYDRFDMIISYHGPVLLFYGAFENLISYRVFPEFIQMIESLKEYFMLKLVPRISSGK